jgi:hypothetical protein
MAPEASVAVTSKRNTAVFSSVEIAWPLIVPRPGLLWLGQQERDRRAQHLSTGHDHWLAGRQVMALLVLGRHQEPPIRHLADRETAAAVASGLPLERRIVAG